MFSLIGFFLHELSDSSKDAIGAKQYSEDVCQSQDDQPTVREAAHNVANEHYEQGANKWAEECPRPTKNDHKKGGGGIYDTEVCWTRASVVVCVKNTGDSTHEAGNHEGDVLVKPYVVAEDAHAYFAVTDTLESQAERRIDQQPKRSCYEEENG